MIEDARSVTDGDTLEAEVCIIGAGAAGITLARELRDSSMRVLLLEGGGETLDPRSQAIYGGRNVGHAYYPLHSSRLRYLGGTTNHWGGMSIPFDPIDFEPRDWVPNSGWPFDHRELDGFIARAHEVCEIGPVEYTEAYWAPHRGKDPFPLRSEQLVPRIAQFSPPTRFGTRYRQDLEKSRNVRTLLGANVVEIEAHRDGDRVDALRVATFEGSTFSARADVHVLAAGAIENARLLLASRSVHAKGLGNQHDVVGRYFMERVNRRSGVLLPVGVGRLRPFFEQDRLGAMGVNGYLGTSAEWQRRSRVLNSSIHLHPSGALVTPDIDDGRNALQRIGSALRKGELPEELSHDLWLILQDLDELAAERWERWRHGEPEANEAPSEASSPSLDIWHDVEPVPNPDSRVRLGAQRDVFGMPRVELDWRLTPALEGATIRKGLDLITETVGSLGLGRVRMDIEPEGDSWVAEVVGSFHQMGTTRMSSDPRRGVVDADCRIHGLTNCYVAGSSVFATAGQANPTLCLLALTVRLADHIRARFEA